MADPIEEIEYQPAAIDEAEAAVEYYSVINTKRFKDSSSVLSVVSSNRLPT